MNFITELFNASARFQNRYAEQILNRFQFLPGPSERVALASRWVEPRGLTAMLAAESRIAVTGALGMGKTTTLNYIAWSLAHTLRNQAEARVPLFFSAGDLHAQALPRITDLPRELRLSQNLAVQCPRIFFPNVFQTGRAVVLIDDADALPPDVLTGWLREFQNATVIVSAAMPLDGFAEFRLPGWHDGDIQTFADKWNASNAAVFFAALKASGVPRALSSNPMLLTILAQIWQPEQPLPTRRAALLGQFADQVLGDADETLKMLEGVALAVQRDKPASNEFLAKARGFMRAGKNRTAEFTHPLWQAYFAARALREAPSLESLREHWGDPAWREVILFYAGLGDAPELIDALRSHGDVVLTGHALAQSFQAPPSTVTQDLVERAWADDGSAIGALSEMQIDSVVDAFAAKLKDKDPVTRARAAKLLGQLQLDRGIEYLLPQLRDVNADVRDQVVLSLGHSRTERVIEPLLVSLRGDPRVGTVDTRMRVAAAQALGEIASDKAAPALLVDLQLGEPEVRAAAADALKRVNSTLILKPLQSIATSGDASAQEYARQILAVLNSRE